MHFPFRVLAIATIGFAAACGGGGDGGTTTPTSKPSTPSTPIVPSSPSSPVVTNAVIVDDNVFNPANIQVSPGASVTWSWATSSEHNVTFSDGGSGNKSGTNASYTKSFSTAGTFNYSCSLHGGMNGSVLVK